MKMIHQNEVAECGYACLAMVLTHFGRSTEIRELNSFRPISANGVRMSDLYDVALEFGLAVDAMRFEPHEAKDIKKGSIVHYNGDHFVVFESLRRGKVTLLNPAAGRETVPLSVFLKNVSGYLLECRATPQLPKIKGKSELGVAFGRIFAWNPELKGQLLKILFISLGVQFAALTMPYFGNLVLDHVVVENNLNLLNVLAITFAGIFIIGTFSQYVQAYLTELVFQLTERNSREALFAKLLRNHFSYFEKRNVGDVYSRIGSQTEVVQFASRNFIGLCMNLGIGIPALILMTLQSPLLTAWAFSVFLVYLGVSFALYPAMKEYHRKLSESLASCSDALIETIRSASLIKLAQREGQRTSFFMGRFRVLMNDGFRAHNLGNARDVILKCIDFCDTIVITYLSANLMIRGEISVGVFFSFQMFKGMMSSNLSSAVNTVFQMMLLRVPVARVNDILDCETESYASPEQLHKASETRELVSIAIQDVQFSYGLSDRKVLNGIDLTLEKGQKIAILGPSGAGKSTLFKLLAGAEAPQQGQITLNGINFRNLAVDEIRCHMAHMRQGDIILNGSIADNISMFAAQADDERINELLKAVDLYDDIMSLPMRTRTLVSDTIANVSAGQKQRLLLARALYQQRELMLLDEPTSNLDRESVRKVGRLLAQWPGTVLLITHDRELAGMFERRFELREGVLVPA